jgi:hypothetical protein
MSSDFLKNKHNILEAGFVFIESGKEAPSLVDPIG